MTLAPTHGYDGQDPDWLGEPRGLTGAEQAQHVGDQRDDDVCEERSPHGASHGRGTACAHRLAEL